jgi:hypothetical protein
MKRRQVEVFALGLILAIRPGCGYFKPKKDTDDTPPHKVPPECLKAIDPCDVGCYERKEGQLCSSCCSEQLILCDEGKPYNIKKCETVEREVRGDR